MQNYLLNPTVFTGCITTFFASPGLTEIWKKIDVELSKSFFFMFQALKLTVCAQCFRNYMIKRHELKNLVLILALNTITNGQVFR